MTSVLELTVEQVVPATPEAVLAALTDLTTVAAWMTNVEAVERADYERATVRERLGGRSKLFAIETLERSPAGLVLQATRRPYSFVSRFRVEEAPEGAKVVYTRAATSTTSVTRVLFKILARPIKWAWAGEMRSELRRLGDVARSPRID